jgi:hypothetical protein
VQTHLISRIGSDVDSGLDHVWIGATTPLQCTFQISDLFLLRFAAPSRFTNLLSFPRYSLPSDVYALTEFCALHFHASSSLQESHVMSIQQHFHELPSDSYRRFKKCQSSRRCIQMMHNHAKNRASRMRIDYNPSKPPLCPSSSDLPTRSLHVKATLTGHNI